MPASPRSSRVRKLKLDRFAWSRIAVTSRSAGELNSFGSRYVPRTRYSLRPYWLLLVTGSAADAVEPVSRTSRGLRLARVNRSTDRFLPHRLLRVISNDPRGASSKRSSACPFGPVGRRIVCPSIPPPYEIVV